eukprot:7424134-Pyramimonas_sp.AAC.1
MGLQQQLDPSCGLVGCILEAIWGFLIPSWNHLGPSWTPWRFTPPARQGPGEGGGGPEEASRRIEPSSDLLREPSS